MSDALRKGDFLLVAIPYDDADGREPEQSAELFFADVLANQHSWLARTMELRGIEKGSYIPAHTPESLPGAPPKPPTQ